MPVHPWTLCRSLVTLEVTAAACLLVMALLRATALALAVGRANANAYPPLTNGAEYVRLTEGTFDAFVGDALKAGKTAMIRWIASNG